MLDLIIQAKVGGATPALLFRGWEQSDTSATRPANPSFESHPLTPAMGRRLSSGLFVVTRDAAAWRRTAASLRTGARGADHRTDVLSGEASLLEVAAPSARPRIAGIVHLAALGVAR